MALARTYLYVPADRESVVSKAGTRGADALILDLEDAVAPGAKPTAGELWVRLNTPSLEDGELTAADLDAAVSPRTRGFVVAKTEGADDLEFVVRTTTELARRRGLDAAQFGLAPIIESPAGLENLKEIARFPGVVRLNLGEVDAVSALGLEPGDDELELLPLRSAIVVASAAAGLRPPAGSVFRDPQDPDGLRRSSQRLRRLGFYGRSVIHPAQIAVVHDVFTPSETEIAAARKVAARYDEELAKGNGVYLDDEGQMIDIAVVRAAWRTLEVAPEHPVR